MAAPRRTDVPSSSAADQPSSSNRLSSSLVRGLAILSAFSPQRHVLGISELAALLSMRTATVHRYVRTLEHLGYLSQDQTTRRYRLATRVVDLGFAALNSMSLRDVAAPVLRQLSAKFGQTANLAVLDDLEIIYADRVVAPMALNLQLQVGSRLPAYCTSMGKALLAFLPPDDLAQRVEHIEFVRRGPNAIRSRRALLQALQDVRERGFAVNDEELDFGLRSVAAPIWTNSGGVAGAINLAVHASRFTLPQLVSNYAPAVVAAAAEISAKLGYRYPGTPADEARSARRSGRNHKLKATEFNRGGLSR
jgi:IclR family pca regulon transcriptional regulator